MNSLDVTQKGIKYRSLSELSSWIHYCAILMVLLVLIGCYQVISIIFVSDGSPSSLRSLGEAIGSLSVRVVLMVFFGYGRLISINVENATIHDQKSFLRFAYANKREKLKYIGRESGESKTDHHKIYIENRSGERIVLFKENRFKTDEKWDEITEHIPERLLREQKKDQDEE